MPISREQLRLLTLNTLFKGDVAARLRVLGPVLEAGGYDIVCLQELMYRRYLRLLRRVAPSYRYCAVAGAEVVKGGLVILSRLPIGPNRFERYRITRPLRPELFMRKGAQVAYVEAAGGTLAIVNTHLSANRDDDWSANNPYTVVQAGELRQLASLVKAIDAAIPVVVTGDLNVPRSVALLAEFRRAAGLVDVLAGRDEPTYRPTPEYPSPPAFDHVLIRSAAGRTLTADARLVLEEAVTLGDGRSAYLSDHFGIETDLTLR